MKPRCFYCHHDNADDLVLIFSPANDTAVLACRDEMHCALQWAEMQHEEAR